MKIPASLGQFSIALAVLLTFASPGRATISTYANLAAWQADNPTSTLQDFNSISAGTGFTPYSTVADGSIQAKYSANGGPTNNTSMVAENSPSFGTGAYLIEGGITEKYHTFSSSYTYLQIVGCGWSCDSGSVAASTSDFTEVGQITFAPPTGTKAMAFDAGQYANAYGQAHDITATVTTTDSQVVNETITNTTGLSFFGFRADAPIASVTLTVALSALNQVHTVTRAAGCFDSGNYQYCYANDSFQNLDYSELGVDNLMIGVEAATSSVPEPASWALLLTVGAVVLRIYGKKRATVTGN